ncbi:tyrosine-type recombinase/integrase [Paraburkholderia ginsengisoli]|uniref:Tyrosine-type recombinase/integrase n=1 Tax=Paraburkholderia ginsengisoli TaxID=311231 RepID=A0A7T4N9V4_9BURK|nr:tyrosine-type recombinase/integrase [Paraburkholderia ginsengisoli]QQC67900.1 tyrosine-type recombinase/integrase [Paraburkholderia ginsengisoli]
MNTLPVEPTHPGVPSNRLASPILPPGLTDEAIVGRWLKAKATGRGRLAATTLAQYRIEAERLFWYARQVSVPISGWTLDEFTAYIGFLQAPAPWAIRARGVRRGSPDWRPFLGPLSDRSAGQTQKIVTGLFEWLRDVGYLQLNPAVGLPTVGRREPEKQARFLSVDDCVLLRETIAARADHSQEARLRKARDLFLVDLFERTGIRTSEAVHCAMGHVRIEPVPEALRREFPGAPPFQWMLRIERGKGGKARWVPCDELALSLQAYRLAFGLPPVPAQDDTLPLLLSVRRSKWGQWKGVRSRTAVWHLMTGLCRESAAYARKRGRAADAKRLDQASTHWLRHTYAKGLAEGMKNGLDTRSALDNMGHADARTFNQYVDDEPLKRALATHLARARAAR